MAGAINIDDFAYSTRNKVMSGYPWMSSTDVSLSADLSTLSCCLLVFLLTYRLVRPGEIFLLL